MRLPWGVWVVIVAAVVLVPFGIWFEGRQDGGFSGSAEEYEAWILARTGKAISTSGVVFGHTNADGEWVPDETPLADPVTEEAIEPVELEVKRHELAIAPQGTGDVLIGRDPVLVSWERNWQRFSQWDRRTFWALVRSEGSVTGDSWGKGHLLAIYCSEQRAKAVLNEQRFLESSLIPTFGQDLELRQVSVDDDAHIDLAFGVWVEGLEGSVDRVVCDDWVE